MFVKNVDYVFCFLFCVFLFSFHFIFKILNMSPPKKINKLCVSYIVQKPYHINDTAWISCCFSIVTIHVFFLLSLSCMYLTYFLFMYCISFLFFHWSWDAIFICLPVVYWPILCFHMQFRYFWQWIMTYSASIAHFNFNTHSGFFKRHFF
jgi:hypothetical protein